MKMSTNLLKTKKVDLLHSCTYQGCEYTSPSKHNLIRHVKMIHEKVRYACDECNASFSQKYNLTNHIKTAHRGQILKCEFCTYTCTSRSGFRDHQRLKHENNPRYKCEMCSKEFMLKNDYVSHVNKHLGRLDYTCENCGKKFQHRNSLTKHMMSICYAQGQNHMCAVCGKHFTLLSHLNQHMKGMHPSDDAKPLECSKCGKVVRWSASLFRHEKKCDGVNREVVYQNKLELYKQKMDKANEKSK